MNKGLWLGARCTISVMLTIVMLCSGLYITPATTHAAAEREDITEQGEVHLNDVSPDSVSITLGETPVQQGITARPGDGPSAGLQVGISDGKAYWKTNQTMNPTNPADNILYFYFNVADEYLFENTDQDVFVTVEYYDSNSGAMSLQYDSKQSNFKDAPLFRYENTGTWKTHTFKLSDANFGNRTHDADFRIGVSGAGVPANNPELHLAKVTVHKQPQQQGGTQTKVYDAEFPTSDIVIADRSVTDYGAIGDGVSDDTQAFKEALAIAGNQGGGVVFVPSGTYKLTGELVIPTGVTLRGDWGNPDEHGGLVKGTILAVYGGKGQANGNSFIKMEPSSGVTHVSIWYPEQNMNNPVAYPWTMEQLPGDSATVKNVTLVNAYQGIKIGPEWNELHYVKDVYGTTLKTGIFLDFTTDIGRLEELHLSPDVWASSGLPGAPVRSQLREYMIQQSEGIVMGRSDWEYMSNIHISGYKTGIRITTRTGSLETANAQLYKIQIDDCNVAMKIEGINDYGLLVTDSQFEASAGPNPVAIYATEGFHSIAQFNSVKVGGEPKHAVVNEGRGTLSFENSSFENWDEGSGDYAIVAKSGSLILGSSTFAKPDRHLLLQGDVATINAIHSGYEGNLAVNNESNSAELNIHQEEDLVLETIPNVPSVDIAVQPKPGTRELFNVVSQPYLADNTGNTDSSQAIQQALNDAEVAGGGTVYMPAGIYRVEQALVIPTGVELRGNYDVPHHTIGNGTVIFTNYGENDPDADAFIQLEEAAGLRGLSVYYDQQTWSDAHPVKPYAWTVQGQGKNVYLIDTTLVNPYQAVDFGTHDTSGHYIDYVAGSPLKEGIYLGGGSDGGYMRNVQFNPHYYGRNNYPNHPSNDEEFNQIWNYQKENLDAFRIGDVTNQVIFNTFVYGSKYGIHFEEQNGRGPEAVVIGHGTDGSKKGAVLQHAGTAGLSFINTELVSMNTTDKVYVEVGPDFGSKAVFFNTSMWGDTTRSFDIHGGDIRIQQGNFTNVGEIGINAIGGDITLYNSYFQQPRTNHVVAGPNVEKMVISNNLFNGGFQIENEAPPGKVTGTNLFPLALKLNQLGYDPSRPGEPGSTLTLTNVAGASLLKGKIELIEPSVYQSMFKPVRFEGLGIGKSMDVALPYLSSDLLKFRVTLENGFRYDTSVKLSQSFAAQKDAVGTLPFIEVSSPEHYNSVGGSWGGPNDLSIQAKASWDAENLVLKVDVKDDIHHQSNTNGDIWQGDSLQLGIDLGKEDGAASKQVNELGFALNQEGVITKWRWRAPEGVATGLLESASASITRDETTHITHYQITLPFAALHQEGYSFQPHKPIGFALLVNENDGEGRSGFMEFNGGIGTSKDARLFGNLYLLTGDYVTLLEQSAEASVRAAEQKKDVTSIDTAANFVTLLPGSTLKSSLLVRLAALTSGSNPNPGGPNPQPGSGSGSQPSAGGGSTTGGKNEPTPTAPGATMQLQPKLDKAAALATAELTNKMMEDAFNRITPDQDGKKKLIVDIESVDGAEGYALTLPSSFLQEVPSTHWLEMRTAWGVLLVPSHLLANTKGTIGERITLVLSKADRSTWSAKMISDLGERPAISLSVISDGKSVAWQNTKTPITISLPYQPNITELLDPEKLAVHRISDDGQMISIPNGKFNKNSEQMIFKTRQNGVYAITQDNRTFQDIQQLSWAHHAIEVLVSKGVIRGMSEAEYQPQSMIRRADFVTLLTNALELQPDQGTKVERFADVPERVYYEQSVNTARTLGIIQGAGADRFSPASPITREEAAVMIYRAMQVIGMQPLPEAESGLNDYKDTHLIKAYARDAIDSLTRSTIMEGNNGSFHPQDTMTRAETAVLLYRLYNRLP
ncbi:S-layer homology domain-containing protein [Paenibacillus polysaccharolyticus]|uniref:glycosyl hydrolase family 28-related protein n=1 Tax=Paenibacillus polysaccharolyticus TaxID=582692 RepID=UPI0020A11826|nr:S-layer homology domain-containing protein [Paenibacillus polysaccharolyticus]